MTFKPTDEQVAIVDHIKSGQNLMVKALAGAAKTSTIVLAANNIGHNDCLALAFNKKIQLELQGKVTFPVKTLNSLGASAFGRRARLEDRKLAILAQELKMPYEVSKIVAQARNLGIVPNIPEFSSFKGLIPDDDENWKAACFGADLLPSSAFISDGRKLLIESIKRAFDTGHRGMIDFGDQIYIPAMFGGNFPMVKTLFVDEAQDLSPLNMALINRVNFKQLIVVGDPNQSIYAWRGADSTAMEKLKSRFNLPVLPLTISFRCPIAVADKARNIVPEFRSPSWAKEGKIEQLVEWNFSTLPAQITVICRNNRPIVRLAFKLAAQGTPFAFVGAQRVKAQLTGFLYALGDDKSTILSLKRKLADYEASFADSPSNIQDFIADKCASMLIVLENSNSFSDAKRVIGNLFALTEAPIMFSTGHGSKGLEWDNILFLDNFLIPSPYAKTEEDFQQETNLEYVITTRAKECIYYADSQNYRG